MLTTEFIQEADIHCKKISTLLKQNSIDAILLTDNANLYYTSGRVFNGYTYITQDGAEIFFVRRPTGLSGNNVIYIRKPEQIFEEFSNLKITLPKSLALELDTLSYNDATRLKNAFPDCSIKNGSAIMKTARSIKTVYEIKKLKESGIHHETAYHQIAKIYKQGMTDIELQVEIERELRLEGSLGIFRISGQSMEIFMGNILCGNNADNPTPYDFAMGGAGLGLSLPVGSNGSLIRRGNSIMVDMCGNFTGYMTDMTRVFYLGELTDVAIKAHHTSMNICHTLANEYHSGCKASDMYEQAYAMAQKDNLENYFMGHKQKAGFIGHGVGIEINELPVIAPRSKDILQTGNVIAIEPKFVIPNIGAVGVENTYIVNETNLTCITNFPEELIELY